MNGSIPGITHSATEADETARADEERPSTEARRQAVKRAQERLRAEVPSRLSTTVRIDGDGKFTQQFSGAGDCGCGKTFAPAPVASASADPRNTLDDAARQLARRVDRATAPKAVSMQVGQR